MNTLSFTGEMARLQQAAAESHDNIARRSTVLSALNLRTGERVLEVGCGGGYYTYEVARGPFGLNRAEKLRELLTGRASSKSPSAQPSRSSAIRHPRNFFSVTRPVRHWRA